MPPPAPVAELLDSVLPLTVSVVWLSIPPPAPAELLDRVQLLTVSVPAFSMPPPWPLKEPLLIVRPLRETWGLLWFLVWATSNTREAWLPLTVNSPAPGPVMVR